MKQDKSSTSKATSRLGDTRGPLDSKALAQLFLQARSHNGWLNRPVDDDTVERLYELARMGPTSMNCCPMRLVFIRSDKEKQRLLPAIAAGNRDKIQSAPLVAVIATDHAFHEHLPTLFPHRPVRHLFDLDQTLRRETANRNGTLQGAYLMLAARALGLDCGPISGFDRAAIDRLYFPGGSVRVNFLCGIGHGDPDRLFPRLPRLDFTVACRIL